MSVSRAGALLTLLLPLATASAQEAPIQAATLERPETPVVLEGSRASGMGGMPIAELRLYAWHDGELVAIPFQIDERTPEESYAYERGRVRSSETDERRLDDNDELVFMARDAGDRARGDAIRLGQERWVELRILDRRTGGQAWVYLLRFDGAPPPRSDRRYLTLDWREGELVGWRGSRVKVAGHPQARNFLHLHQLCFSDGRGNFGPDVLDQAKLAFKGSYLFVDIRRQMDEMRAKLASYVDGPIRLVSSCSLELYLVWGHWIRTSRGRVKVYGNRLELELELELPVSLEKTRGRSSKVRFSFDFLPSAGPVRVGTDTNLRELHPDSHSRDREGEISWDLPRWIYASLPTGSVLVRLKLADDDRRASHELYMRGDARDDPPEDVSGSHGNVGFALDLTGLRKGTYPLKLILQFGPPLEPGRPEPLLRVDDAPLRSEAEAEWRRPR